MEGIGEDGEDWDGVTGRMVVLVNLPERGDLRGLSATGPRGRRAGGVTHLMRRSVVDVEKVVERQFPKNESDGEVPVEIRQGVD